MNRPHDEAIAQAGPQDDSWETELEAAFFDPADDGFETVDAAPERVESVLSAEEIDDPDTLEREVSAVLAVPIDPPSPERVEPFAPVYVDDDDLVIQVVPRWVWPTVALMAMLAVGGTAFGLGAIYATSNVGTLDAPVTTAIAPLGDLEPALVEEAAIVPPVRQQRARAKKPRPLAPVETEPTKRPRKKKPRPLVPAPQPTVIGPHVPAAPAPGVQAPVAVAPPTDTAPKAPPASVSDLPAAVSVGSLQPGAAL